MEAVEAAAPNTRPRTLEDTALAYAGHGWHVFPCALSKSPLTKRGLLDATTDVEQIRTWWREHPDAAIGIACGASHLVVIDYDPDHDPDEAGRRAIIRLTTGGTTRQARTGSGGTHYYYRAAGDAPIRNSAGKLGPGIDIRADGGYVIAPPSRNLKGAYSWLNRSPCLPLPAAVVQALAAVKNAPVAAASGPVGEHIPEGRRNETLISYAGTLRKRGMSPLAIEAALLAENGVRCNPPLPEAEVREIAKSVTRYPEGDPGYVPPMVVGSEPTADAIAVDAVRVTVTAANGSPVALTFTEMEKFRKELSCQLSIRALTAAHPYNQRINLESQNARRDTRVELDSIFGKDYGWGAVLNTAWALGRKIFLDQDRAVSVLDIPPLIGMREMIRPLMPSEGMTILFGDGSSSKSYFALLLAVSSVTGTRAAGQYDVPQTNVLYIDYEDSDANFQRRARRVMLGKGLTPTDECLRGLRYWNAGGVPIADQKEVLKREIQRQNIGWIIVDSAAPACGGPPEESSSAIEFNNALKALRVPALVIAHITKSDAPIATEKPFGTIFWHNNARRTWFIRRTQDTESDHSTISLTCKKVNDGQKPSQQGIGITFEGEEGEVTFRYVDVRDVVEMRRDLPLKEQVWNLLRRPLTVKDIAAELEANELQIRRILQNHPDSFCPSGSMGNGTGRPADLWGRKARGVEHEPF